MNEPAWIEHDGSAVCPVAVGGRASVRFKNGCTSYGLFPNLVNWENVTHYRDWTAFKQQEAMGKDVPEWAWDRMESLTLLEGGAQYRQAFARYIAAHEQPPVDWLAAIIEAAQEEGTDIAQAIRTRIPNIDSLAAAGEGE